MHRFVPGDMAYLRNGARMAAAIGNTECWNTALCHVLVVATSDYRLKEAVNGDVSVMVTIFVSNEGLYDVAEGDLWTADQVGDLSRLFPVVRLPDR